MATAARRILTTAATLLAAAGAAGPAFATAQSRTTTGPVISQGADGTERTIMCPPDENALGGGFAVSAPDGRVLDAEPGDLLTSRPTADATGWIVAVRKGLHPAMNAPAAPADLTLYVVCTEGETAPGD